MLSPLISLGSLTPWFELFVVVFLGVILGSFSTALIFRVPRDIAWAFDFSKKQKKSNDSLGSHVAVRSACPHCNHILGAKDLIPLLSWLFQRGKCRYCGEIIPVMYPLAELLCMAGVLGIYVVFDLSAYSLLYMALIPFLVALLFIDLEHLILPNELVGIAAALGALRLFVLFFVETEALESLAIGYLGGALLYGFVAWILGVIMDKILKKETLGFGDVKFFMMVGLWLGAAWLPYFMILSGVLGMALAVIWRIVYKQHVFPFGPALIVAFYILVCIGGSHL